MLLAVEGGGFFSSSASGYSNGLTLLLFGQRKHDDNTPMRVAPWNHYPLVDQGPVPHPDPNLQLASLKNRLPRGCTSFICFERTSSSGLDSPSHLKVGPADQQDVLEIDDNGGSRTANLKEISLKSSLKKPSNKVPIPTENVNQQCDTSVEQSTGPNVAERRKVHWTDVSGSELAEIREFEPSEMGGSDDELESRAERTCSCVIM